MQCCRQHCHCPGGQVEGQAGLPALGLQDSRRQFPLQHGMRHSHTAMMAITLPQLCFRTFPNTRTKRWKHPKPWEAPCHATWPSWVLQCGRASGCRTELVLGEGAALREGLELVQQLVRDLPGGGTTRGAANTDALHTGIDDTARRRTLRWGAGGVQHRGQLKLGEWGALALCSSVRAVTKSSSSDLLMPPSALNCRAIVHAEGVARGKGASLEGPIGRPLYC